MSTIYWYRGSSISQSGVGLVVCFCSSWTWKCGWGTCKESVTGSQTCSSIGIFQFSSSPTTAKYSWVGGKSVSLRRIIGHIIIYHNIIGTVTCCVHKQSNCCTLVCWSWPSGLLKNHPLNIRWLDTRYTWIHCSSSNAQNDALETMETKGEGVT